MVQLHQGILSVEDYIHLRKQVNFIDYKAGDVEIALGHSLYKTSISHEGKTIAIGRLVGDGRLAFFLKDVVVLPDYQGKKIGEMIVRDLLAYIGRVGADKAYIGVMARPGTESFYEKFGFVRRPNQDHGSGLIMYLNKEELYDKKIHHH